MAAEVVAQQLGREQREVREAVGLARQRRVGAHREGEGLVLLDQVEEALAAQRARRVRRDVRGPPRGGDEAVGAADLEARALAGEHDLDAVEEAGEPLVGLQALLPVARQRRHRVDGDDPHPQPALGQAAGEVELRDVAAEEVLEVDRRDEQVDPLGRVVADRQLERRDLLGDDPRRALGAAPARARGQARGGQRVEAQQPAAGARRPSRRPRGARRTRSRASIRRPASRAAGAGARALRAPTGARAAGSERSAAMKRSRTCRLGFVIRSPQRRHSTVANCTSRATSTK